jgi:hypothetical protein
VKSAAPNRINDGVPQFMQAAVEEVPAPGNTAGYRHGGATIDH